MKVTIKNGVMTITLPINKKLQPSSSGKTLLVASSHGNKETEAVIDGQNVFIGLNAYVYVDKR